MRTTIEIGLEISRTSPAPMLRAHRCGRWTSILPALVVVSLSLLAGCASEEPKEGLPVYCLDKPSKTSCHAGTRRYYYDYGQNSCRAFNYCGGRKLFESRERCEEECVER